MEQQQPLFDLISSIRERRQGWLPFNRGGRRYLNLHAYNRPVQVMNRPSDPMVEDLTRRVKAGEDISSFKHTLTLSRKWCNSLNSSGDNIFQTAITSHNKEAFDLLLPFYDIVNLEERNSKRQSALMVAVGNTGLDSQTNEYFVTELIKNGAFIHTQCRTKGETCLHVAIVSSSVNIVKILLEKGLDVNVQDRTGSTALHMILKSSPGRFNFAFDEKVALLMYYNADPLIEDKWGCIPFDYAVQCEQHPELQETLFNYTFDKDANPRINIGTIINLCHVKSPLFSQILKYRMKVYASIEADSNIFFTLLDLDNECLKLLARKCSSALGKIFWWESYYQHTIVMQLQSNMKILASSKGISNLVTLLESSLKPSVLSFIQNLNSDQIVTAAVENNNEEVSTEIILFFLSHGMPFTDFDYHTVYEQFGYCNLFKQLLYIGLREPSTVRVSSTMPRFIYNFTYDELCYGNITEVLDCMVDRKLADFLWNYKEGEHFSAAELERIRGQPQMPLLVQLARDSFRKYLIKAFSITSTGRFYSYVDKLPISLVHKKIITYETKLY